MEEIAKNIILQFGAVGILITILVYITNKLFEKMERREKEHKEERDEWRNEQVKMNSYMVNAFDKNISLMSRIETKIDSIIK